MPETLLSIKDAPDYFGLSSDSRDVLAIAARIATAPWVDPEVFLRASLEHGQRTQTATAGWLWNFLMERSGGLLTSIAQKSGSGAQALAPELSAAFLKAKSVRYRTFSSHQSHPVALRHLLFGLFTEPTCSSAVKQFFQSISVAVDAAFLERQLVNYLRSSLEIGESWDEWLIVFGENGITLDSQFWADEPGPSPTPTSGLADQPILVGEKSFAKPLSNHVAKGHETYPSNPEANSSLEDGTIASPASPPSSVASEPQPQRSESPVEDRVPTQADDPATQDQLGRRGFAVILSQHIRNFRQDTQTRRDTGAFMFLVDGPWGSGKTSVLNLLSSELNEQWPDGTAPQSAPPLTSPQPAQPWIIVNFNAWRHQRTRPPWWSLIKELYTSSQAQLRSLSPARARALRYRWCLWHIRHVWSPAVIATAVVAAALLGLVLLDHYKKSSPTLNALDIFLKVLSGCVAIGATFYGIGQTFLFGSTKAAQTLSDLRSDPLQPVVQLFTTLYDGMRLPLIVYIDDLDRCTGDYVVELLEGIQTLLRTRPLVYVVAADRKWICSSYEKTYADFGNSISEPGRPLGYLFLDKIFQLTAALPRISPARQQQFWDRVLSPEPGSREANTPGQTEVARNAEQKVAQLFDGEKLLAAVKSEVAGSIQQQAVQVAAARQITKSESQEAAEHRLKRFAGLLEPNPRAIKRLANAYSLHQATHLLQGRSVDAAALARWTILELRWPLLTDLLARYPEAADLLISDAGSSHPEVPETLRPLFRDKAVRAVTFGSDHLCGVLDQSSIRTILDLGPSTAASPTPPASPPLPPA